MAADIKVVKGTDRTVNVNLSSQNQVYDLTGATITVEYVDGAKFALSPAPTATISDAENGVITVTFSADTSYALGTAYLRIWVTDSGGQKHVAPDPATGKTYFEVEIVE